MFPSDTDFETKITFETDVSPISDSEPFHILLLGDWSGKESRQVGSDLNAPKPIEVDKDTFDDVIRKFDVELNLQFEPDDNKGLSIRINELDDFHPDKVFQQLPLFADLRDVRSRLLKPKTYDEAAQEVRSWLTEDKEYSPAKSENPSVAQVENSEPNDLLEQIIGKAFNTPRSEQNPNEASSELSTLVKKLVKPYLIETDTVEQSKLLMIVDEVISDIMRRILHHPQFQSVESAWRGLYFLIRRIETSRSLKIFLLDISKNELSSNLKSVSNLEDSRLYKIISGNDANQFNYVPWALVCGNYTFSLDTDNVAALMRIGKVASNRKVPFISYIKPEVFGFESFAEIESSEHWKTSEDSPSGKLWMLLRSAPESQYMGLAMQRVLARLPFGEKTEPTEIFYFEEFTSPILHEQYLWLNPVFAISSLVAQTFQQFEWNLSQNFIQDINELPMHLCYSEDQAETKPGAEILMTQSNYEKMMEQGIIPLISYKDSDRIRVSSFQSIASPRSPLKGKWK